MIVDELRRNEAFRELTRGAHVFRVPFDACPITREPDGIYGLWWRNIPPENLIPIEKEGRGVDCSWWRPPFEDMIICSERAEQGCLVVLGSTSGTQEVPFLRIADTGEEIKDPEWSCILALMGLDEAGKHVICQFALHTFAVRGKMYSATGTSPRLTAFLTALLCGRRDDSRAVDTLANTLIDLWRARPREHTMDVANMTATFATTCALLACRNIVQETVAPAPKLQAARQRRNELPLVTYKTLKLHVGRSRKVRDTSRSAAILSPLAQHWVRGHFKHYTEDAPLLGRAVGTFWWSPHLAGRADRVVVKDYSLEDV